MEDGTLCRQRGGGSDGDRFREIDVVALPLIPFHWWGWYIRFTTNNSAGYYGEVWTVTICYYCEGVACKSWDRC
jgi:hypothetical protein